MFVGSKRPLWRLPRLDRVGVWACLAALLLGACATTSVPSITDTEGGYGAYEDERKLIKRANESHAEFHRRGMVFENPELQRYVEEVASQLIPPGLPTDLSFRFTVLRLPNINAFAAVNGDIYLHAGLLAHLENEAQMAHVLAHEISHTLMRHQLTGLRDFQNKTVAAKLATVALAAVGSGGEWALSLVGLSHAAAVSGYGRELEQQADLEGLKLIAERGYATEEAPKTFFTLNEVEEPGDVEAFFYSSHPSNSARAAYTESLIETGAVPRNAEGRVAADEYTMATREVVLENIRLRIRARHYEFALREIESALARYGDDALLYCYRGNARRRIAEDPEGAAREQAARRRSSLKKEQVESFEAGAARQLVAATAAYELALELEPLLALAHRGLGLTAYRGEENGTALRELSLYLDSGTGVRDRRFIERILEELAP